MNHYNRSNRTAGIVVAVAFLGTGIASAQTRPTLKPRTAATALRALTPTNSNRSSAFQSLNIDRVASRPFDVKSADVLSGYSQPRAGDVAVCPVVAAALAILIMPAPDPAPVTTWMPSDLDGISRGNLTNLGMYDR